MAPSTLHYYGAQSRPQTKKSQPCQPALTPCWDVNGCQDRSTLYYCMSGHPPQPVRDPVKPEEHSDNPQSHVYIVDIENS